MIQYCLIDIAKDIWEALSVKERLDIEKILNSFEQECVRSYNHCFKEQSASRPVDNQMKEVQSLVQTPLLAERLVSKVMENITNERNFAYDELEILEVDLGVSVLDRSKSFEISKNFECAIEVESLPENEPENVVLFEFSNQEDFVFVEREPI